VRILSAIIQVTALTVLDIRQKLALSHAIALQLIGDENARHVKQPLQETLEEALRRPGAAAGLHQNVKNDAVLIDGAPEIMLFTVDPNEEASGAGQLHPRALSEPDVILSHHPAPIVRPLP
jgi:hypothetical protein